MAANSTAMPSLSFALLMLFLLLTPTHSFHNDRQSLLTFKRLITTDPNQSMADWNPANPFCNWTGVTCNRRHPNRVASLNLIELDLSGSISPSLGNLSFLRTLDLYGNKLTGHIPPQLGRLFRLRELVLAENGLEGNIPSQLSSCRNLTLLALSYNHLIGNIPRELSSLPHLQRLYLGGNELTAPDQRFRRPSPFSGAMVDPVKDGKGTLLPADGTAATQTVNPASYPPPPLSLAPLLCPPPPTTPRPGATYHNQCRTKHTFFSRFDSSFAQFGSPPCSVLGPLSSYAAKSKSERASSVKYREREIRPRFRVLQGQSRDIKQVIVFVMLLLVV